MDAFSASLMADKREIIFAPTVYKFQTFAQMAEEFKLNERDVVLTNEFIYTPFMKDLGLKCHYVFQEKFGAGEPSEEMIQVMYDAIPYDSYDRVRGRRRHHGPVQVAGLQAARHGPQPVLQAIPRGAREGRHRHPHHLRHRL